MKQCKLKYQTNLKRKKMPATRFTLQVKSNIFQGYYHPTYSIKVHYSGDDSAIFNMHWGWDLVFQ